MDTNGVLIIDGEELKWRRTMSGVVIEMGAFDLYIRGEPEEDRVGVAVSAFRQGYKEGLDIGRQRIQNEFRVLMGCARER